ncbi:unnamed protein product, partial [Meganyctiphanes norvegica]
MLNVPLVINNKHMIVDKCPSEQRGPTHSDAVSQTDANIRQNRSIALNTSFTENINVSPVARNLFQTLENSAQNSIIYDKMDCDLTCMDITGNDISNNNNNVTNVDVKQCKCALCLLGVPCKSSCGSNVNNSSDLHEKQCLAQQCLGQHCNAQQGDYAHKLMQGTHAGISTQATALTDGVHDTLKDIHRELKIISRFTSNLRSINNNVQHFVDIDNTLMT